LCDGLHEKENRRCDAERGARPGSSGVTYNGKCTNNGAKLLKILKTDNSRPYFLLKYACRKFQKCRRQQLSARIYLLILPGNNDVMISSFMRETGNLEEVFMMVTAKKEVLD